MADVTLTVDLTRFPEGTTVGAYAETGAPRRAGAAPPGSAADTADVTGGQLAFTGLTNGQWYVAAAEISDEWRQVRFRAGADRELDRITISSDVADQDTLAWDEASGSLVPGSGASAETPPLPWLPEDQGLLASPYDPAFATTTYVMALGYIHWCKVQFRSGDTEATKIQTYCYQAGGTLTAAQCKAGVYDSSGALIAQTSADLSASASSGFGSTGAKSIPLTAESGKSLPQPGDWYRIAFLFNGSTAPTFFRKVGGGDGQSQFNLTGRNLRWAYNAGSTTSLPATDAGTNDMNGNEWWAALA